MRRARAITLMVAAIATSPLGAQRVGPAELSIERASPVTHSDRAAVDSATRSAREVVVGRAVLGAMYGGVVGIVPGVYAALIVGGVYAESWGSRDGSLQRNVMIGAGAGAVIGGILGANIAARTSCARGTRVAQGALAVLGSAGLGIATGATWGTFAGAVVGAGSLALGIHTFSGCG